LAQVINWRIGKKLADLGDFTFPLSSPTRLARSWRSICPSTCCKHTIPTWNWNWKRTLCYRL